MPITQNPTIDLAERDVFVYYLTGGSAIFGCVGDPEGQIIANKNSLAISDNGNTYTKTTDNVATGWQVNGGGGGSGTVTSVALAMPGIFTVSGSPVTVSGTLTASLANQAANEVWAGPTSGGPAAPTFRQLRASELSPFGIPINGVLFSTGSLITSDTDFLWDTASGTLQVGLAGTRAGKIQIRGAVSGSVTLTVDQPSSNHSLQFPNALPSTNDLFRAASVSGSNIIGGWVAPSALGLASVNPTSDVIPYNNAGAFADSPIRRLSSSAIGSGTSASDWALVTNTLTGNLAITTGNALTIAAGLAVRQLQLISALNNSSAPTIAMAETSGGTITGCNALQIGWSNNNNGAGVGSQTVGLTWRASGVARVSNGSTGAGQFAIGTSTVTTSHQFAVDSQATGRIAGFFSVQGGATQPAIEAQQAGSLIFRAGQTGKLQGSANLVQIFSTIGNAKSDVSTIGNVGTGVDNLLSFVIVANALANTGDYCEFDAFGEFENNANNKTLKIVYGATTIFNTGAVAFGTSALANWRINAKIIRTGATAQKCIVTFWSNDSTTPFLQEIFITGEDNAVNRTVQFTGEATATDDITQLHLESKICTAQTS